MQSKNPISWLMTMVLGILLALMAQATVVHGQDNGEGEDPLTVPAMNLIIPEGNLNLLQPLDDKTTSLPSSPGIQIFFDYFNIGWPWLLGTAAGVAVFWALFGGLEVILSGGDPGKRQAGMDRLLWALAGLLLIAFAGLILRTLNPLFYK